MQFNSKRFFSKHRNTAYPMAPHQGIFTTYPFILPLLVILVLGFSLHWMDSQEKETQIGILEVKEVILNAEKYLADIEVFKNDESIKGVIVRIDSPGGGLAASQEVYQGLKQLGELKPLYASMANVAASGAYYIAMGAERVFANPGTITGSIGVIMQSFNATELLHKVGVNEQTIKSGAYKDTGSPFRKMREDERDLMTELVLDGYEQFLQVIVQNRDLLEKEVRVVADGRILSGNQAFQHGLIDDLGGLEPAIDAMRHELGMPEAKTRYIPEEQTFFMKENLGHLLNFLPQHSLVQFLFKPLSSSEVNSFPALMAILKPISS